METLRRALAGEMGQRVMIGDFNRDRGEEVARAANAAGFDTVLVGTGRELLRRAAEAAEVRLEPAVARTNDGDDEQHILRSMPTCQTIANKTQTRIVL